MTDKLTELEQTAAQLAAQLARLTADIQAAKQPAPAFKVGDRVTAVKDNKPWFEKGATGLVVKVADDLYVKFDGGTFMPCTDNSWYGTFDMFEIMPVSAFKPGDRVKSSIYGPGTIIDRQMDGDGKRDPDYQTGCWTVKFDNDRDGRLIGSLDPRGWVVDEGSLAKIERPAPAPERFAVGDWVRVVERKIAGHDNGTIGLVTKVTIFEGGSGHNICYVKADGKVEQHWFNELERAEAPAPAIPAGWTDAKTPPLSERDIDVMLKDGATGRGYHFVEWYIYTTPANDPHHKRNVTDTVLAWREVMEEKPAEPAPLKYKAGDWVLVPVCVRKGHDDPADNYPYFVNTIAGNDDTAFLSRAALEPAQPQVGQRVVCFDSDGTATVGKLASIDHRDEWPYLVEGDWFDNAFTLPD